MLFELVIGVLFAALFITAYLLIAKLLGRDRQELDGMRPFVTLNPLNTAKNIAARATPRALTTGEMSAHHAHRKTDGKGSKGKTDSAPNED